MDNLQAHQRRSTDETEISNLSGREFRLKIPALFLTTALDLHCPSEIRLLLLHWLHYSVHRGSGKQKCQGRRIRLDYRGHTRQHPHLNTCGLCYAQREPTRHGRYHCTRNHLCLSPRLLNKHRSSSSPAWHTFYSSVSECTNIPRWPMIINQPVDLSPRSPCSPLFVLWRR